MPRLGFAFGSLAAVSFMAALWSPAVLAQSAPADIPAVMSVCTPVVGEEYDGNKDRWGQCIAAVGDYLKGIGAPSEATNQTIADLVAALVELYRNDQACVVDETELPIAIETAAQLSTDGVQQAQILEISATIQDCQVITTAAIPVPELASAN
ncbi:MULTISPECIES: hypothetical protein [unclassified Devosia]|jgi:hypothetical protein|uniref:hypothetical protein n=1 Tax=unclassified Devosia TaxID=196773 RepID=UPI000A78FAB1|nr:MULTISPECIES: hypothetical protein [unclassified Devosia]MBN9363318.1 hypothetical protein [Devosia sp.]